MGHLREQTLNFQLLKEHKIFNWSLKILREGNCTSSMYIFFITRINKESPIIPAIITVKHGYKLSFFSLFLLIVMLYFPYIKTYIQLSVCVCAYMHVYTCYVCVCVKVTKDFCNTKPSDHFLVVIVHDLSIVLDTGDHPLP